MRLPIVVAACLIASAASAQQQQCGPSDVIMKTLKDKYAETPIGGGMISQDAAIVVVTSPEGKTFSILTINKEGLACFIGAGSQWDTGVNPAVEG